MSSLRRTLVVVAVVTGVAVAAQQPVAPPSRTLRLPALLGDHMLLQRDIAASVWGWAEPGTTISIAFATQQRSAVTGADGRWQAWLDPMPAGGPFDLVIRGDREIAIHDVFVGDVWVGSGQSNMEWPVSKALNAEAEIAGAAFPQMRLFTVPRRVAETPQEDVEGHWDLVTPQSVGGFSAVAYFFGRELHTRLKVPVGLIHSSWGGTPAEAWTSRGTLEASPALQPILLSWRKGLLDWPQASAEYTEKMAEWQPKAAEAKAQGQPEPPRPQEPQGPGHPWTPAGLFNGMLAPLVRYTIRGAIWYQGESNARAYTSYEYRDLFPAMIADWRVVWNQGAFPFLFVQLANFLPRHVDPIESHWAELRESQWRTVRAVPNTGMAVTIDIGDPDDIHPRNKQEVGRRLSLEARRVAYGESIVSSGPLYRGMRIEGTRIRVAFDSVGGGLVAKPEPLAEFAIAGRDARFVRAEARIDGPSVVVSSAVVPNPVAVRYAWQENPQASLYNREGLPASPFRTDDWSELNRPR
jgi:sialate O-acetylesterase